MKEVHPQLHEIVNRVDIVPAKLFPTLSIHILAAGNDAGGKEIVCVIIMPPARVH